MTTGFSPVGNVGYREPRVQRNYNKTLWLADVGEQQLFFCPVGREMNKIAPPLWIPRRARPVHSIMAGRGMPNAA